jgi:hypothetical protein
MTSKHHQFTSFTSVILAFTLIAAPLARAADASETAQYRSLLADAVSEYEARRFDEARALFRRANDLSPNARTLRGIGMASFELRDYVEAYRALLASLAEKRKPLTPDQRRQIEGLLEKTRAFTAHFAIRPIPADATVRVDGDVPLVEADGRVTLGLGRHTIAVDAAGRVPELREIHVFGGENRDLDFRLRLVEQPMAASTPPIDVRPVAPPATPPVDTGVSNNIWWFAGAGTMAVGAVITGILWHSREQEISTCLGRTPNCLNLDTLTSQRSWTRGATIGLAAGALGLGIAGAVLWSRSGPPEKAGNLACAPAGQMMYCSLLF